MVQKRHTDDRFWNPTIDSSGNGSATIRFLPEPKDEDFPWVKMINHGFKNSENQWYIENSLQTIGKPDPVSELINRLYGSGIESDSKICTAQDQRGIKRKTGFITNIIVVRDTQNREMEGKVFLFRFGKKIFDKLNLAMNPAFEDDVAFNPFDFWKGANFKIKIRQVEGQRNYDSSEFESPTELYDGDEKKLELVWNAQHSLKTFHDESNFKTYDELANHLVKILGDQVGSGISVRTKDRVENSNKAKAPPRVEHRKEEKDPAPVKTRQPVEKAEEAPPWSESDMPTEKSSDGDDDFAFFQQLAKG